MSLEKAIKHGKERRKPYYGSAAFDHSCRPGGGCPWCERNRTYQARKAEAAAREALAFFLGYDGRAARERRRAAWAEQRRRAREYLSLIG